jgi:hypothetical protein
MREVVGSTPTATTIFYMRTTIVILIALFVLVSSGLARQEGIEVRPEIASGTEQEASAGNIPDVSLWSKQSRAICWREVRSRFLVQLRHGDSAGPNRSLSTGGMEKFSFALPVSKKNLSSLQEIYRL